MEKETKLTLGKILGEIYRIQKHSKSVICPVGNDTIFGLLNGFEETLEREIESLELISSEEVAFVSRVLNKYFTDEQKLNDFNGYYDIEAELEERGIDRIKAKRIITMFKAEGRFLKVIEKMDSSGSPAECRTFEIPDYEM
ncbi:hypothetical protein FRY98_24395 [Paenibacillus faecis]|uniref:Uncharacterized protein n=1 Tax=Paenibacillus faecis TaxID=862114 RepID=A0A5D0CLK4_9BACL|nr:hypothetical protein [Paenibacillus faecis]TYA10913.1 hypothetical protein FRY98_24395 [Paenibacillus faecis]